MRPLQLIICFTLFMTLFETRGQTIPNNGMETWVSHGQYDDPQSWDTPNRYTCFIPYYIKVVTKSSDHQSGSFSARLETKTIPLIGVTAPGVISLGTLVVDMVNQTYAVTGGVPISDAPTHLKGYFKYQPQGGDSCAIGIILTKWNGSGRDTLGTGYFSTKETIATWTQFSAWIDYSVQSVPDTMNIVALSSASYTPTAGTVLFVDDLFLDYTVSVGRIETGREIRLIQDADEKELVLFMDFPEPVGCSVRVLNTMGQEKFALPALSAEMGSVRIPYHSFAPGLYIVEVLYGDKRFTRKLILNP